MAIPNKFKWILLFIAVWLGVPQPSLKYEQDILPLARQWVQTASTKNDSTVVDPQQPLRGVKVVITGSTSGIGLGLTQILVKLGATVIALGRSETKLANLKQQVVDSNLVVPIQVQLADLESVKQASEQIQQQFDSIDVLINCAGTNYIVEGSMSKTTPQNIDQSFGVNYVSHFLLTEKMIPLLTASNYHPTILQISSSFHWAVDGSELVVNAKHKMPLAAQPQGLTGQVFRAQRAYANSKLAQVLHARSLQRRHSGIRVRSACPGWVATPILTRTVQKFVLGPFAFPANGFGIKSALYGVLDLQSQRQGDNDNDNSDFMTNTGMSGVMHSWPKLVFTPLVYRLRIRDFMFSLYGIVFLHTQRFWPEIKARRSSPESYKEEIQEALYEWSYDTVKPFL